MIYELKELEKYFEEELRRHYDTSSLTERIYFFSLREEKLFFLLSDIKFLLEKAKNERQRNEVQAFLDRVRRVKNKALAKRDKYIYERDWFLILTESDNYYFALLKFPFIVAKKILSMITAVIKFPALYLLCWKHNN